MRRIKSEGSTEQSHPQQGPSMREPPIMTPPPVFTPTTPPPTVTAKAVHHFDEIDEGETVAVTWGEELYSPQQFFTFRVGPFSSSTKVRRNESRAQAGERIMRQLEVLAADERVTKMKIFLETMGHLFAQIKGAKA